MLCCVAPMVNPPFWLSVVAHKVTAWVICLASPSYWPVRGCGTAIIKSAETADNVTNKIQQMQINFICFASFQYLTCCRYINIALFKSSVSKLCFPNLILSSCHTLNTRFLSVTELDPKAFNQRILYIGRYILGFSESYSSRGNCPFTEEFHFKAESAGHWSIWWRYNREPNISCIH